MITDKIIRLNSKHLSQAKNLITEYPDIFSSKDIAQYNTMCMAFFLKSTKKVQLEIFIYLKNDKCIGIISYHNDSLSEYYWKIEWLIIDKEFINQGLGTKLFKETYKKIKQRYNATHLYLETSAEKHNSNTKNFYNH